MDFDQTKNINFLIFTHLRCNIVATKGVIKYSKLISF